MDTVREVKTMTTKVDNGYIECASVWHAEIKNVAIRVRLLDDGHSLIMCVYVRPSFQGVVLSFMRAMMRDRMKRELKAQAKKNLDAAIREQMDLGL